MSHNPQVKELISSMAWRVDATPEGVIQECLEHYRELTQRSDAQCWREVATHLSRELDLTQAQLRTLRNQL